jgi:NADP-dependent 3-hydroxy acid dehydrogenase YdfG
VLTLKSAGIGAMMAKSLDANGAAKVYIIGRRLAKLQEVAVQAKNGSIVAVQGDVTSKGDLESIAKRVEQEVGFINGIINSRRKKVH